MGIPVHHIELWTSNLQATAPSFAWLLTALGWRAEHDPDWPQGRMWQHRSGMYVVLEQSPAVTGPHDRTHAGLNHLAFSVSRERLDLLRAAAGSHGWRELFPEHYPHAGGEHHTALYLENGEGFEVELVAD